MAMIAALDRAIFRFQNALAALDDGAVQLAAAPHRMRWESRTAVLCRDLVEEQRGEIYRVKASIYHANSEAHRLRAIFQSKVDAA